MAAGGEDEFGAAAGQFAGHGGADAGASAGDEGPLGEEWERERT